MNVLLDTNILGRMVELGHPQNQVAQDATDALRRRGDLPCIVPQVLYEVWVVATRPVAVNGLGLSVAEAAAELTRLKALFPLLRIIQTPRRKAATQGHLACFSRDFGLDGPPRHTAPFPPRRE